jgi:AAA family ATP:ADP antiporter
MENQPLAKAISVLMTVIVVSVYDFLTSVLSKPDLFLCISGCYGLFFFVMAALLSNPDIGLSHTSSRVFHLLGFVSYTAVESYGSLMVALFWSFTNSTVDLELAKGAYGLIICFAQVGAIIGSTLATRASTIGIPVLYMTAAMIVLIVGLSIKLYFLLFKSRRIDSKRSRVRSSSEQIDDADEYAVSVAQMNTDQSEPTAVPTRSIFSIFGGFYEGIQLISNYKYTWYLLGVSTLYEIVLTVLDYEFKLSGAHYSAATVSLPDTLAALAVVEHPTSAEAQDKFAQLLGQFGQVTNLRMCSQFIFIYFMLRSLLSSIYSVALAISVFGFSFVVKRLGVKSTLLIFPFLLFAGVVVNNLVANMWVLFIVLSTLKAVTFSLNEPVKELLYMPTSEAIKFKAKAWIDVFGARCAKALGSYITSQSGGDLQKLREVSEIPVLVITLGYILLVWAIGVDFDWLVTTKHIVGAKQVPQDARGPVVTASSLLPTRNGLRPGDVGYDGYTNVVDGAFSDEEIDNKVEGYTL